MTTFLLVLEHGASGMRHMFAHHRVIALRNDRGVRLVDIFAFARLERPTVHRILKCLIAEGCPGGL
ncbi:associated with ubiquinone biosynthesis [Aromatoleum bremense]|nr:associated with ubiquinone biosynthesis [Aromatoleum bremense]